MSKFFIAALPRSRTAWLANMLTTETSICFHEGIRRCSNLEEYIKLLDGQVPNNVGDSSSALVLNWRELAGRYPQAKWVVIRRPFEDVLKSGRRAFPQFVISRTVLKEAQTCLLQLEFQLKPLVVEYDDVNDRLNDIANHCCVVVPSWRQQTLKELNVQIHLPTAMTMGSPVWMPRSSEQERLSVKYVEAIREMCGENTAAFHWLYECLKMALTWDHLIDKDPVDPVTLNEVFHACLVNWPVNPFFTQNGHYLVPTIYNAILAWRSGNAYQVYTDLPLAVALLIGGPALAESWSPKIRTIVKQIREQDDMEDVWQ